MNQISNHLNEILSVSNQERSMKIKEVNEHLSENVAKTQELEARTMTLETAVVDSTKITKYYLGKMNTLK